MPDEAKMRLLQKTGMRIARTCATCVSFSSKLLYDWGDCQHPSHSYTHSKHNNQHQGPCHTALVCSDWEPTSELRYVMGLGQYADLLPPPSTDEALQFAESVAKALELLTQANDSARETIKELDIIRRLRTLLGTAYATREER